MPKNLSPTTRYRQRKRYYAKHRQNATNGYQPWTIHADRLVAAHEMRDVDIAASIGRSVEAIQMRRFKLKNASAVNLSQSEKRC
jgi:hypothetical protein